MIYLVPEQYLSDCFEDNKTIIRSDTFSIYHYIKLNQVCQWLNASMPSLLHLLFLPLRVLLPLSLLPISLLSARTHIISAPLERRSVPREYIHAVGRDKIIKYLEEIRRDGKEWKKMRIVVLGNKGIGKTSLVEALKRTHQGRSLEWFEEV